MMWRVISSELVISRMTKLRFTRGWLVWFVTIYDYDSAFLVYTMALQVSSGLCWGRCASHIEFVGRPFCFVTLGLSLDCVVAMV